MKKKKIREKCILLFLILFFFFNFKRIGEIIFIIRYHVDKNKFYIKQLDDILQPVE